MKRNQPYFGTAETVAGSYTYNTNYKADVLIRINYKEMNGRFLNCLCDEFSVI